MADIIRPRVFVSYSWEDEEHIEWTKKLANHLIENGVDIHIDQYDLELGDRLPQFMKKEITRANYVLIICTPNYKEKADNRQSGVGYEGHIIAGELFQKQNERKFIPIIRKGEIEECFPTYLLSKLGIDFKDDNKFEEKLQELLATIYGRKSKPKPGNIPIFNKSGYKGKEDNEDEKIKVIGILTNEVTVPKMDGTRGSALYKIPFKLSRVPSELWENLFIQLWNSPPQYTTMHRPGIASVIGDKIILDGTTIDEVKDYHRDILLLCVNEANKRMIEIEKRNRELEQRKKSEIQSHYQGIQDVSKDIKW